MDLMIGLVLVAFFFILLGCGAFRRYVAPEKIRWYDLLILLTLLFVLAGIDRWIIRLGGLFHAAYFLGAGLYAVEVIDARPFPKGPKRS